jgi:hypothetical protein
LLNDLWEFNPTSQQWAWMGGSSSVSQAGVYGTPGTAASGNIPGSRAYASSWTDGSGNFWLLGGQGLDSTGTSGPLWNSWQMLSMGSASNQGDLNDLWEFNPSNQEWAWMGGASSLPCGDYFCSDISGVFGTFGSAAAGNLPGSQSGASVWTDSSGNHWLFGGGEGGIALSDYLLNNLWEFNTTTSEWAWVSGSTTLGSDCTASNGMSLCGVTGVYEDPTAANNNPGSRVGASAWTDHNGNLWLFGGYGVDSNGNIGVLNDLWEYQLTASAPTISGLSPASTTAGGAAFTLKIGGTSFTSSSTAQWGGTVLATTYVSSTELTALVAASLIATVGTASVTVSTSGASSSGAPFAITQGTPSISWPAPAAITYGTALSAAQLNATSATPGTLVYTPSLGTMLNAGMHPLSVNFTPTDSTDYTTANATVQLTVNGATPAVTATPSATTINSTQTLTVTVAVSGVAGAPSPTGSMTLTGGGYSTTATLSGGALTIGIPGGSLKVGSDTLTVNYVPDSAASNYYGNSMSTASITVTAQPPFGSLDSAMGATSKSATMLSNDTLSVLGWAADVQDGAPVRQVQILIDGVLAGNGTLGGARPDVATYFKNPAYANSGWSFNYAANTLSAGQHTVSAVATDSFGISTTLDKASFTTVALPPPFGGLDTAVGSASNKSTLSQADSLLVTGWVADQTDGAPLSNVKVYVDGIAIGTPTLGLVRPDVATYLKNPAYLNSGYQIAYPARNLSAGSHAVTVVAINSGGESKTLGPLTVTVAAISPPFGGLDSAVGSFSTTNTLYPGDLLQVTGWVADQTDGAPLGNVKVYVDGVSIGTPTLGLARPDVATYLKNPAYTNSGYRMLYAARSLTAGTHAVTVVAVDSGGESTTLGPLTITVKAAASIPPPFGSLDTAVGNTSNSNTVYQGDLLQITGWAADQTDGSPMRDVKVFVDGVLVGTPTLGVARPDVAAYLKNPAYAEAGYEMLYPATSFAVGAHAVTVTAMDSGGQATTFGPLMIDVVAPHLIPAPFGGLDQAVDSTTQSTSVFQTDSLLVTGWAADQTDGSPLKSVWVNIDGAFFGAAITGLSRPDVAAYFDKPAYIQAGYQLIAPVASLALGSHTVTVVAANSGGQTTTLGPLTINVQAPAAIPPPFGGLDQAVGRETLTSTVFQTDSLLVSGWAADQTDGSPVKIVRVYVDGVFFGAPVTGLLRADVATYYNNPAFAQAGYQLIAPAASLTVGSHKVTVVVEDSGGQTTSLGQLSINVLAPSAVPPPFGSLDQAIDSSTLKSTVAQTDSLLVTGWVADQTDGAPLSGITIYVDGKLIGSPTTGQNRSDVAAYFNKPAYALSGYKLVYPVAGLSIGTHAVTAMAIDKEGQSSNFGPIQITVVPKTVPPPFGNLEEAVDKTTGKTTISRADSLLVTGWVADQTDGAPLGNVKVYIDGNLAGTPTLGLNRSDVAAYFDNAAYTNAGYSFTYSAASLAVGTHQVTVVATDTGAQSTTLGPLSITAQ